MDYSQALDKLHSLNVLGIRPGLQRMEQLLQLLGHPERSLGRCLHIAGTNGKGSTAMMLTTMLIAAGQRVGTFTSPHLHHHCERYQVNSRPMSEEDFARLFSQVWQAIGQMRARGEDSPTEFEAATSLAMLHFAAQRTQWAVLECGLGGRLDSTNVITPEVSIITSVAIDHEDFLGHGLVNIAAEKAGIIKPGRPVVTAANGQALDIIRRRAVELDAPLYVLGEDFTLQANGPNFSVTTQQHDYLDLTCALRGAHQQQNAACAVQAAELIQLDTPAIRSGLAAVSWPGRMEVLSEQPLIVLDGAHNEQGMAALAEAIRSYWPERRICAILGMLADKQREQALQQLIPLLSQAYITPPPLSNRAGDWRRITEICRNAGLAAQSIADPAQALAAARAELASGRCDMLLVAGSLYLLADLRQLLLEGC